MHEGTCQQENFFEPSWPKDEDLLAVHGLDYITQLSELSLDKQAARKIGFPLSEKLVEREHIITPGTIEASSFALEHGIAMNIAGGTHHAYADHGEAFCLFNDQAIVARYLQNKRGVEKILMVDLDVHQGNGTAKNFQNDTSVFTFSMHGASNYPFRKEQNDLDLALPDDTQDEAI